MISAVLYAHFTRFRIMMLATCGNRSGRKVRHIWILSPFRLTIIRESALCQGASQSVLHDHPRGQYVTNEHTEFAALSLIAQIKNATRLDSKSSRVERHTRVHAHTHTLECAVIHVCTHGPPPRACDDDKLPAIIQAALHMRVCARAVRCNCRRHRPPATH